MPWDGVTARVPALVAAGMVTYSDVSHVSVSWSRTVAGPFAGALRRALTQTEQLLTELELDCGGNPQPVRDYIYAGPRLLAGVSFPGSTTVSFGAASSSGFGASRIANGPAIKGGKLAIIPAKTSVGTMR